jgi:hypothetical protein
MARRSRRIPDSETIKPLRSKTCHGGLGVDPRFTGRERQPGLDLLRALAIIVVVIYHAALFGFLPWSVPSSRCATGSLHENADHAVLLS